MYAQSHVFLRVDNSCVKKPAEQKWRPEREMHLPFFYHSINISSKNKNYVKFKKKKNTSLVAAWHSEPCEESNVEVPSAPQLRMDGCKSKTH